MLVWTFGETQLRLHVFLQADAARLVFSFFCHLYLGTHADAAVEAHPVVAVHHTLGNMCAIAQLDIGTSGVATASASWATV